MGVKIRQADKTADLPAIIAAAHDFATRIDKPFLYPADPNDFEAAIKRVITLDAVEILIAELRGRMVGGLGLLIAPFPWDPDRRLAEEIFFWCAADAPPATALSLLRAGCATSRAQSASHFMMHVLSSSPAKLHRAVERLGFEALQSSYVKVC